MPPAINSEILANRNIKPMVLFLTSTLKNAQNPTTNIFQHKTYERLNSISNTVRSIIAETNDNKRVNKRKDNLKNKADFPALLSLIKKSE